MCLGVPGRVIELINGNQARVDVSGNLTTISVMLTPQVRVGEYVLIHAGFAMEIVDEEWALESQKLWEEMEKYARQ
ncbi:MAG: HypC/HybG/HupF family hydrogenase formation chaperone [Syntrophomonadaceae bacterium]|jgi:hydrogenase expression/formation protein HypC|nr:HypC/HybG/HupF family hydrogenase formation chaperone [Syntrophomonadaceae bacterium]